MSETTLKIKVEFGIQTQKPTYTVTHRKWIGNARNLQSAMINAHVPAGLQTGIGIEMKAKHRFEIENKIDFEFRTEITS